MHSPKTASGKDPRPNPPSWQHTDPSGTGNKTHYTPPRTIQAEFFRHTHRNQKHQRATHAHMPPNKDPPSSRALHRKRAAAPQRGLGEKNRVVFVSLVGRIHVSRLSPTCCARAEWHVCVLHIVYLSQLQAASCKCAVGGSSSSSSMSGLPVACGKCQIDCGGALPAPATKV